jgi:acyl-CoA reductase-like NAD-dependent aldehyde dehydrogenase
MATQITDTEAAPRDAQAPTLDARVQAGAREEIVSYDPATNKEIGRVPVRTAEEVRRAVERAREAQAEWAAKSYRERGRVVLRAREIVLAELDAIAELIARESGKPATEAISMELIPI